eukprot:gb/GFBE01024515.1/.p1 GENE.gb/GFBE01024515.1/~~gb/GFBE01024515.1/.p1  ORF type:complete len:362 (+),score=60.62 gb/GFBE01024515.1/:1-1086(+)
MATDLPQPDMAISQATRSGGYGGGSLDAAPEDAAGGYEVSVPTPQLRRMGFCQALGPRTVQEDRVSAIEDLLGAQPPVEFFAVYDGHGGSAAVEFVQKKLPEELRASPCFSSETACPPEEVEEALRRAFRRTETELLDYLRSMETASQAELLPKGPGLFKTRSVAPGAGLSPGSCAVVALLCGKVLHIANLGDCRALLNSPSGFEELTQDHRPDARVNPAEMARIDALGIEVSADHYLGGHIGVSRAFGDMCWERGTKFPGLLATPDVSRHELDDHTEFLLLACDGIFEKMKSQEAVQIVRRCLRETKDAQAAAQRLVEFAEKLNSEDNLSALVVLFKLPQPTDKCRTAPRLRIKPRSLPA